MKFEQLLNIMHCDFFEIQKERKIIMKYYIVGTRKYNTNHTDFTDEWTAYQGFDYEEAKKALAEEQSNYECYSTKQEKATHEVFGEVYELPEDLDTSDEDEITNALCDCCCCDDFE